jgi:NAD(P)-dependent dehydrogenase (short-subunit alcohol dehydrogenase family)
VDHLVVTAAQTRGGGFRDDDEATRFTFEGKFWAQHRCVRLAQVRRSILLTSGTLSRRAFPGTSAIAAVNGAVEALGRALALELAPVRVNVLSPGFVRDTEAYAEMPEVAREGMFAAASSRFPVGMVGNSDSVAGPALALLASPYVTGVVLDVDGGGLLV